jgi:hypothetical protein
LGRQHGGVSGQFANDYGSLHVAGLPEGIVSERAGSNYECSSCSEKTGSKESEITGEIHKSPVKFRLLLALLSVFVSLVIGFAGWHHIDHDRRGLGLFLVGLSSLIVCGGMLLLWLSRFTLTWGWLL